MITRFINKCERLAGLFLLVEYLLFIVLFSYLSDKYEFRMLLTHKTETKMWFFDEMTAFLNTGGMLMIARGLLIMVVLCVIAYICTIKFKQYQSPVLLITYILKATWCVGSLPVAWFCIMNERLYSIEVMVAVIVAQLLIGFISFALTNIITSLQRKRTSPPDGTS